MIMQRNYTQTHTTAGFTLMETIIYVAIFMFVSVGSIAVVFTSQELLAQYQVRQSLFVTSTTIMERVLMEVREADATVPAESAFATSTGALALETASGTKQFLLEDNRLTFSDEEGEQTTLQPDSVEVTDFFVEHYTHDGGEFVRISLAVFTAQQDYSETYTLRGGAVIRGSYAQE